MTIKINIKVGRFAGEGKEESTIYQVPMTGEPLADFNISSAARPASTMRYMLFRNGVNKTGGYGVLAVGTDHGVPVFSYRYALDNAHLSEILMQDGLTGKFVAALGKKIGEDIPFASRAAEHVATRAMNRWSNHSKLEARKPRLVSSVRPPVPKTNPE